MNITLVFQSLDKLPPRLRPLQGVSGKIYTHAQFDPESRRHVARLTLDQFKEHGRDIVQGFTRPLSMWILSDVEIESDELSEAKLADDLDRTQVELADVREELAKCKQERDAAIRAILGRQDSDPETRTVEQALSPAVIKELDAILAEANRIAPDLARENELLADAEANRANVQEANSNSVTSAPTPASPERTPSEPLVDPDPLSDEPLHMGEDEPDRDAIARIFNPQSSALPPEAPAPEAPVPDQPQPEKEGTTPQPDADPSLRERLAQISNFRSLRKQAVDAGVPNAAKMVTKEEVVAAWLTHANTPSQPNG